MTRLKINKIKKLKHMINTKDSENRTLHRNIIPAQRPQGFFMTHCPDPDFQTKGPEIIKKLWTISVTVLVIAKFKNTVRQLYFIHPFQEEVNQPSFY